MPATFIVSDDGTYLIETLIGHHTPEMQRETARELFALMESSGIRKVLVDARAQLAPMATLDAFTIWDDLAPQVPRGAQFAILVNWPLKGPVFAETVAINRGVSVRYFNDEPAAVAWLKVRPYVTQA